MTVRALSAKETFIVSGGTDLLDRTTVKAPTGWFYDPFGGMHSFMDYMSIFDNYEQDQGGYDVGDEQSSSDGSQVDPLSEWYDALGLGSDVDAIINQSALLESMLRYLEGINPDLIKITNGANQYNPLTGQIELNISGLNATQIVGLLAHEIGHSITEGLLYNFPVDTKANYVAHGINLEAQAILFTVQVAYELEDLGVTVGIPGKDNNGQQYLEAYKNNINDVNAALSQIESLMITLGETTGSGVLYADFYGDYYDASISNTVNPAPEPEPMGFEDGR